MSSLFKGGGEESNRVQRVKTKLERWKVQAVDMVCGKYFHHPSSFQFLCLHVVVHYPCVPFLPIPFLHPSCLLIVLPFTGLHIHTTVGVLLCLSVQLSVYWSDVRLTISAHQVCTSIQLSACCSVFLSSCQYIGHVWDWPSVHQSIPPSFLPSFLLHQLNLISLPVPKSVHS